MIKLVLIIFFLIIPTNINSQTIGTIHYEEIFKKSIAFNKFLKKIDKYKNTQLNDIKKIEKLLIKEKDNLDNSRAILSDLEFNKKLLIYNNKVDDYENKINLINQEIYNSIEESKELMTNEIDVILQILARKNNIEIIFSENNYVIATKKIDLTDTVINELNKRIKNIKFKNN